VIGIAPTGARILDQLGLFENLNAIAQGIRILRTGFPDGSGVSQTWVREFEGRYVLSFSVGCWVESENNLLLTVTCLSL
jgi:hypothetical protein